MNVPIPPIYFAEDYLKAKLLGKRFDGQFFEIMDGQKVLFPKIKLNLTGNYQVKNMLTALQAILIFDKIKPKYIN